jgi:RNA polymerase sigma factor (sigma-70 family)
MDRVKTGDEEAASQLVADYGDHVMAAVRFRLGRRIRVRVDSHDLAQAIWKSFFELAEAQSIDSPQQLVAILAAMSVNKLNDAVRRHIVAQPRALSREDRRPLKVNDRRLPSDDATPSQLAMARERFRQIFSKRTSTEQQVIRLRMAGHTFEDIGQSLGINERTARRVIEKLWEEHGRDET